jgi:hypothetical protein
MRAPAAISSAPIRTVVPRFVPVFGRPGTLLAVVAVGVVAELPVEPVVPVDPAELAVLDEPPDPPEPPPEPPPPPPPPELAWTMTLPCMNGWMAQM